MTSSRASSKLSNKSNSQKWKILVLGPSNVGKRSLMHTFVNGIMEGEREGGERDLLEESLEKNLDVNTEDGVKNIDVIIQNVPNGIEMPTELAESFFSGVHGAVLVFSTLDQLSFINVTQWYSTTLKLCGNIPFVFAENKIDEIENSVLDKEEVEKLAKEHKMRLYRVSAKAKHNVEEVFNYLICKAISREADVTWDMRNNSSISNRSLQSYKSFESSPARKESMNNDWTPPEDSNVEQDTMVPEKRRTDGVKPVFNRHAKTCTIT